MENGTGGSQLPHGADPARYELEEWTPDEEEILRRYFTNLEGPVFALVNLPEVVKGALFARYSRSSKSLRRLFLDEFVGDLDVSGDLSIDATVGLARAEQLYDRVFFEYGDDSVAQLGGVHLACEQASNLLTKVLERGRLMSYMEKSTRYVAYDTRMSNGRFRYYRDPAILESHLGARFVGDVDRLFDAYGEAVPELYAWLASRNPCSPDDSDLAWRRSLRAKAFDALRGMLPAAATSNLGIYGSGQAYEGLLVRMRAHALPEARDYAHLMLTELRKVIPSWVKRVDVADRGEAWGAYQETNREAMAELASSLGVDAGGGEPAEQAGAGASPPQVTLVDWDPDAEVKVVAAALYPYSDRSEEELARAAQVMSDGQRLEVLRRYAGERTNRRYRPGRALERCDYRFDVVSDYGAFRDLQRHRLLTVEWQQLTPALGYSLPPLVEEAGLATTYRAAMQRSGELHQDLRAEVGPVQAAYAVALAFRIRYVLQCNAREAMHLLELRTTPQGHPEYRQVGQQMHRLIEDVAGHRAIAAMMRFVDHSGDDDGTLGRLAGERRAQRRRSQTSG
ncbi:MAG: FAD-dependent thymidylate synthase [Acidimicrobiales bacterium]